MRLLLLLPLLLISCRDQDYLPPDPHDAWRIDGRWVTLPPASPMWQYEFEYPHMRQWIVDLGVVITEQEYIFAPIGDRVEISGDGGQRTWEVRFFGDTVCEYRRLMPGVVSAPAYYLKREP